MTVAELKKELELYPDNMDVYAGVLQHPLTGEVVNVNLRIADEITAQSILIYRFSKKDSASMVSWTMLF